MTSTPAGGLWRLKTSRASRFALFRTTAGPSLRVAETPSRGEDPPLATTNRVMNRPWTRTPLVYAR